MAYRGQQNWANIIIFVSYIYRFRLFKTQVASCLFCFVFHAYWHSHHWILVAKAVAESNFRVECINQYPPWRIWYLHQRTWPILTLNSAHSTDRILREQNSIWSPVTQKSRLWFSCQLAGLWPWPVRGQHLLAMASLLRRHAGNSTGSWRTGAERSTQTHLKTFPGLTRVCCVRGCNENQGLDTQRMVILQQCTMGQ